MDVIWSCVRVCTLTLTPMHEPMSFVGGCVYGWDSLEKKMPMNSKNRLYFCTLQSTNRPPSNLFKANHLIET